MKIVEEFKSFAVKGNVVDMSVGIIVGGAFSTIVSSLVKDVVMPPIGLITGNIDFSNKVWVLKEATESTGAITINYGLFTNAVVNFLIISIVIFMVIKQMNKLRGIDKKEEKPAETPADIKLLTEIRDELRSYKN